MKKTLSLLCISVAVLLCPGVVFAQGDYKNLEKDGDREIIKGNYEEAINKYSGALASMNIKKIDKNSTEYMGIERKLNGAKSCLNWSRIVDSGLQSLSEANILSLFENAESADDMETIKNDLLSKVKSVQTNTSNILQRFPSDKETAKKKALCDQRSQFIQTAMDNQEELLVWIGYRNQRTLEAYNEFLSVYPNGKYRAAARDSIMVLREVQAWASLSSNPSESALQEYAREFPNGKHANEVNARLRQIETQRKDENAWNEAVRTGTSSAFKQYVRNFPQGNHRSEADRRFKLAEAAEDDAAWNEAEVTRTIDAYKKYLVDFPKGRHAADAQKGQSRVNDHKLWDKYRQTDTKEAYQAYLSESSLKIHGAEARNRINEIEMAEKQAEEEALWAETIRTGSEEAFKNYLIATTLNSHKEEANAMIALKHARQLKENGADPNTLVQAYAQAEKLNALSPQDKVDYQTAKDDDAYLRFKQNADLSQGKTYIKDFPDGNHAVEVSDAIAMTLADQLTWKSTESEYQEALRYAVTQKTKNYVTGKYDKAKKDYARILRKQNREPFHVLLGIGAESIFDEFGTFTEYISESSIPNLGVTAALSLGGHSNRINFEVSGGVYNYFDVDFSEPAVPDYAVRISATPRLNIIRKRNLGDSYSAGYFYIAPEASFDMYGDALNHNNISLGAKVGFGLSIFDFYFGYHSIVKSMGYSSFEDDYSYYYVPDKYFSVGMMVYLSGK